MGNHFTDEVSKTVNLNTCAGLQKILVFAKDFPNIGNGFGQEH